MSLEVFGAVLATVDTTCWIFCFWWMHRISVRQDSTLKELHDVTKRIEALSKEEHDLIREVQPVVEKIEQSVQGVADAVSAENSATKSSGPRRGK